MKTAMYVLAAVLTGFCLALVIIGVWWWALRGMDPSIAAAWTITGLLALVLASVAVIVGVDRDDWSGK